MDRVRSEARWLAWVVLCGIAGFGGACAVTETGAPAREPVLPDIHGAIDLGAPQSTPAPDALVVPGPCAGLTNGSPCDDQDLCTVGDQCKGGFCVPGAPLTCDASKNGACRTARCEPASGCVEVVAPDGASCPAPPCYTGAQCLGGECHALADARLVCPPPTDPCADTVECSPKTGTCDVVLYTLACPAGTLCRSGKAGLSCIPVHTRLCRPCVVASECADPHFPEADNVCLSTGDPGSYCATDCTTTACPAGFDCVTGRCRPAAGASCSCRATWAGLDLSTNCATTNASGSCPGERRCTVAGLSECDARTPLPETCDDQDNDCDGETDEGGEALCGPLGACCTGPGQCVSIYETACAKKGGKFQGPGVKCADAACGGTNGACCAGGVCQHLGQAACDLAGGLYYGDGHTCAEVKCGTPPPLGACCGSSGLCNEISSKLCTESKGKYSGDGTGCGIASCEPLAACCLADTQCLDSSKADCQKKGGVHNPNQLLCSLAQCLPSQGWGACCLPGGGCAVLDPGTCSGAGGQFLLGEGCSGQCKVVPVGACCLPGAECTETQEVSCTSGNTWHGAGVTCTETLCIPAGHGACCLAGECYGIMPESNCFMFKGTFKGAGKGCSACKGT